VILFLNAPGTEFHQRSSRWGGKRNRSGYLVPPIFLATAAAYLQEAGFDSRLLDAAALGLSRQELLRRMEELSPDLVVIEASTISIEQDARTARRIRETCGAEIALVGLHVTALPEETLRDYGPTYVCLGEYEEPLLELARCRRDGRDPRSVPGLGLRCPNGTLQITPPGPLKDLNRLPIPLYRDLPLVRYWDPIVRNHPCISIRTMRGCPFRCEYCVAPQLIYGKTVRFRDPERVVEEIRRLQKMGVREIFIDDETFTLKREHVLAICAEMARQKVKIDWSCFGRVDLVDRDLLLEMRRAGCYMIRYGVESSEPAILEAVGKGFTPEQVRNAFSLTHSLGLKTHATVMYGSPGETEETMRRTLSFTLSLDPDYAQFTINTPYPGTAYYRKMKEEGRILAESWEEYDGSCRMIVRLDTVSPEKVEAFVDASYRAFYFRPRYILKRLRGLRRKDEVGYLFRSAGRLLAQTRAGQRG